ncbi:Rna-binding protein, partial [Globisporangium splendens]
MQARIVQIAPPPSSPPAWMPMGTLAGEKHREAHARDAHSSIVSPPSTAASAKRAADRASPSASPPSVPSSTPLPLVMPVAKSRLILERVVGVTSLSNAMIAVNSVTGEIACSAGCIVVIYNLRRNKQVRYYRVEKSVACMAFSHDGRYLLSAGLVHDQHVYAWDLKKDADTGEMNGKAIGAAQIREKVLSMDYCQEGNFFVSVGEKHFKFWFLDDRDGFLLTGYAINDIPEMQHRDAVMSTEAEATFTSVACGYGACRLKTFAITSDGTLCCFGASCIMERLVSLEATHGNAISVTKAYVAVAGSSSIVRLFDPSTLGYRSTMPFPPPLGKGNEPNEVSSDILHPDVPHRYPAVIAVRVTGSHVIVLCGDRSLFIYDWLHPRPAISRVMESLSVFTAGYEIDANQVESPQQSDSAVIDGSKTAQQTKLECSSNVPEGSSAVGAARSLSSLTAEYEVTNALSVSPASSPCPVVSSTSSSTPSRARESSAPKSSSADTPLKTRLARKSCSSDDEFFSADFVLISALFRQPQKSKKSSNSSLNCARRSRNSPVPTTSHRGIEHHLKYKLGKGGIGQAICIGNTIGSSNTMADVGVEKKLGMSLDQIADERKHENSSYHSNSSSRRDASPHCGASSVHSSSNPAAYSDHHHHDNSSNSPRGHHYHAGGHNNNSYAGGKTKNTRRADRIASSAPYQSRGPRFGNGNGVVASALSLYICACGNHASEHNPADSGAMRRVYVGNLSWGVTWQMLKDHMRSVGNVEHVDILESNGRSKGCAIVTFAHQTFAQLAVMKLNDTELDGRKIFVRMDREEQFVPQARPSKGCRVYVGNLSWNVKWQDLKDHMKQAGVVVHADVLEEAGGRSKGCGLVEYGSPEEAQHAIRTLNDSQLDGRMIFVREDREPEGGSISMIAKRTMMSRGGGMGGGRFGHGGPPMYPPPPHMHQYPPPHVHQLQEYMHPVPPQYPMGGGDGRQLYIGNLPWETNWQSLKDLFRTVGDVERSEIAEFPDGKSRGFGIIRFYNPQDAWLAIDRFNGAEINGRVIEVRLDRRGQ